MFMNDLRETNNVSLTENGALGYKTTNNKLVDLNFAVSSMRNWDEEKILKRFAEVYAFSPVYFEVWLFFLRDIRGGMGERKLFRIGIKALEICNSKIACSLLKYIPEYGRWDDLIECCFFQTKKGLLEDEAAEIILSQFNEDRKNMANNKPISLLAKWLPSNNTSSKETKHKARFFMETFRMTEREYRKTLSLLRKYLDVVERKMSSGEWNTINYPSVPSRAAMIYRDAFVLHDKDRYYQYMDRVKSGEEKINAGALFPYAMVSRYNFSEENKTLEAQWAALPSYSEQDASTLVVLDTSYSMEAPIGMTHVTAEHVAVSIALYFAERMRGQYKNSLITFSSYPQVITFPDDASLAMRLQYLDEIHDCSNTDIHATFLLVLKTAVEHHLPQSELPRTLLIVSDMEFDFIADKKDQRLFDAIAREYAEEGYVMPRLVFWNVMSSTNTIPVKENENGVVLVSGFSQSVAKMVFSEGADPWSALLDILTSDRYRPIYEEAMKQDG